MAMATSAIHAACTIASIKSKYANGALQVARGAVAADQVIHLMFYGVLKRLRTHVWTSLSGQMHQ